MVVWDFWTINSSKKILQTISFFPQQQNAKGSLHNIDFGVFWASWGGSGKELGSGTGSGWQVLRLRGPVPGTGYAFRWFRQVLLFQGSGFSFRETGFRTRGIAKVLGSEGCVPEVSKVSVFDEFRRVRFCSQGLDGTGSGNRVPGIRGIKKVPGLEIPLPRFRKLLCTYFESKLLYFESILLYFESILLPQCLLQVALKISTARAKKRW